MDADRAFAEDLEQLLVFGLIAIENADEDRDVRIRPTTRVRRWTSDDGSEVLTAFDGAEDVELA